MPLTKEQMEAVIDNGGGITHNGVVYTDKKELENALKDPDLSPVKEEVPATNVDNSKVVSVGDETKTLDGKSVSASLNAAEKQKEAPKEELKK